MRDNAWASIVWRAIAAAVVLGVERLRPGPARRLRVSLLMPTAVVDVRVRAGHRKWHLVLDKGSSSEMRGKT